MSKPCCFRRWFIALALLITNDITLHLCSGRRTVLLAYIKGCITGATCRKLLIQIKKSHTLPCDHLSSIWHLLVLYFFKIIVAELRQAAQIPPLFTKVLNLPALH